MKNYKLPVVGFALVLLISSCKKEDVKPVNAPNSLSASSVSGQWNSLTNWSSAKANDNTTTYFSQISDSTISAAVTKSGLVLVFKKDGESIQSLPFLDKSTGTYWYYQVSKGSLRIDGNIAGSQANFNGQNFSYFVLSPEQISNLEGKGKKKFDLMQSTYAQAVALFK